MLTWEWIIDYVLFILSFIGCIIFLIFTILKNLKPDIDNYGTKDSAKFILGIIAGCLFTGWLVYSKTFPDRWNCPDCEQVNIYDDSMFQTHRETQSCSRCDKEFRGRKVERYKSSKPFYSLP